MADSPPVIPDASAFEPPIGFIEIAERLESEGFEAWAVGGCLRDTLVESVAGRAYVGVSDWDLTTDAHPEQLMDLFPRTVPVGVDHGTVGVLVDGVMYEVTTFRRDVETDGRHATVTFAETIEEDLGRRDFTINAIAWRPRTGDVRDPYEGLADLGAGTLRAVGEPTDRFREDYLRVLRGMRFAGRFDLEVEARTREAMSDAVGGLDRLSAERVHEELMKVMRDPFPSSALDLYATHGALDAWYPELVEPAAQRESWLATLDAVDALPAHRPLVRIARLLAQIAAEPQTRVTAADQLLTRLRFSNADRRRVTALVLLYLPFVGPLDSSAEQRRWLSETGPDWRDVFRMHFADARACRSEDGTRYLVAAWRQIHDLWLERPPLRLSELAIGGDEILELGVAPGPLVRLLLEELLEQVLEDPERNERETLLSECRRLIELGSLSQGGAAGGGPGSAPHDD